MSGKAPERSTVFISYSHKDTVWKDRLVRHLEPLRQIGNLEVWEDRRIRAGEDWKNEIDRAIERARVALLLVSPDWLASDWIQGVEAPQLLERADREEMAIIPIILRPCTWQEIPWLSRLNAWPYHGEPLASLRGNARDQRLADLARQILQLVPPARREEAAPTEPQVAISRISSTASGFFGREDELKRLDDFWENPQVRIVSIVGLGGIGKTALVSHWLGRMARDRFRGAERVFGWSFAEPAGFLPQALRWFEDPDSGYGSPEEQADRLAQLIRARRTLLVLDRLDLAQDANGNFLVPALERLIHHLSSGHRGLVLLISRIPLPDGSPVHAELPLGSLPPAAATSLLHSVGVRGPETEIAATCLALEGHPLSLELFGKRLREVHGGDIRQRGEMAGPMDALYDFESVHRMIDEYERLRGSRGAFALLRLFGLFDRPATDGELKALCSPPIPGLTDVPELQKETDRTEAAARLIAWGLLSLEQPVHPGIPLRAHPLVRQHFRQRLWQERPEAIRQGHERLFRFLTSSVGGQPQTLEEMTPLVEAVSHGCAAGLWSEALELYRNRISRGQVQYLTRRLGAAGTEIKLLSAFFDQPWERPRPELNDDDAALILGNAGNALFAAGRTRESQAPVAVLLEKARSLERWTEATWAARHLAEAQIFTGHLAQALITAREAVELSEKTGEEEVEVRQAARIILADVHHQAGRLQEAWQTVERSDLPSYRYLDLLLARGRFRPVLKQVSNQRLLAERSGDLLRVALSHLALGRAQMEEEGASSRDHFDQSVDLLRRSGFRQWLPAGLLARAGLELLRGTRLEEARRDLEEALAIATRSELRLYEADAHLAFTRLSLQTGETDRARQSLSRARSIIDDTGYHRRDAELQELETQLSSAAAESPLDPVTLAFRLVLAGHATPDLLLHPDPGRIEEAARRLSDEPGDPLLRAQRILEEQQPGVLPNPLWAAWVGVTHGKALQQLGKRGSA